MQLYGMIRITLLYFQTILLWFMTGLCFKAVAQVPVKYESYTSEQGLSENVIYCQLIDSRGFLWVGTDFGLNRFDGTAFKPFLKLFIYLFIPQISVETFFEISLNF